MPSLFYLRNIKICIAKNAKNYFETLYIFFIIFQPFIGYGWSVPFQITIALYLLYQTLGASAFAGFFLMIILIPINGGMVAKQGQLHMQMMKHKDSRIKTINEILQGMKIIKLYGWEPSFQDQVADIRHRELD